MTLNIFTYLTLCFGYLQYGHDISADQSTIHILMHYAGQTPDQIHQHFIKWVPNHINWIRKMSSRLLNKKKLDVMVYLQNLLSVQFKFNEIALIMYARMYQLHVGVILKD